MKKILTKLLALSGIGLLMLSACKKSDPLVVNAGAKSSSLTTTATTLVLDKTKLNDTSAAIMFTFTAPTYNYKAVVKNSLQIDAAGDNWKNPASAQLGTTGASQGYSTAAFNTLLLKLNLPAGVASQVNVRVVNALSTDVATYSNTVTLTVTPFNLESWLYVPGAYEGWANPGPQEDSLLSATDNGIYVGIINFTAGNNQFLVLPVKGSWTHKYATNDAQGSTSSTVAYDGPNNYYAPSAAGQYLVTFNINNNTISFAPANFYSVIGDAAQGWGTDVPMKFINDGNLNWVATLPLVSTGAFKIRQSDDWTYSWGIPKPGTAGDGIPNTLNDTQNNNISIPASGNYKVVFNIPITLAGATPVVTTTYSVTAQ
jgi:hypothetical protein